MQTYTFRHKNRKRYFRRAVTACVVGLLLVGGIGFYASQQSPLSSQKSVVVQKQEPTLAEKIETAHLPWPHYGQAAIGAKGAGVLAANGKQVQQPIASVAKVMTALAILKKKPLKLGQQGPIITITAQDKAIYDFYRLNNGSLAPVVVGEKITEYQALEALLLPSANNFADTLAIWAFGSLDNYSTYANQLAKDLGLKDSNFTSASGFDETTVGTAQDLIYLGIAAMEHPVIAEIVAKQSSTIPVAGPITNTNKLLGVQGINGIKTGTYKTGGVFLGARSMTLPDGQTVQLVSVVMGAPNTPVALADSASILLAVVPSAGAAEPPGAVPARRMQDGRNDQE